MKRPHPPIACVELLSAPITADDVIAQTLSIVRGRLFGRRSTEVKLLRVMLRNDGFDIYRVSDCDRYRLVAA